jgi:transposase
VKPRLKITSRSFGGIGYPHFGKDVESCPHLLNVIRPKTEVRHARRKNTRTEPKAIARVAFGQIGIDAGFSNLLTTSDGETIEHPREMEASAERLAQAQRGHNKQLAARIQERVANRKRDKNHKLSRRLVSENILIAFSKDNIKGMAKRFGKSAASSAHYQLRQMLSYKMPKSGGTYVEPESKFSAKTCNECGSQSGPTGLTGLSVRQWSCSDCGFVHDRDVNAARNILSAAAGCAVEGYVYA